MEPLAQSQSGRIYLRKRKIKFESDTPPDASEEVAKNIREIAEVFWWGKYFALQSAPSIALSGQRDAWRAEYFLFSCFFFTRVITGYKSKHRIQELPGEEWNYEIHFLQE